MDRTYIIMAPAKTNLKFDYFLTTTKSYDVGTRKNRLNEPILSSTHNIFGYEKREIIVKWVFLESFVFVVGFDQRIELF